MINEKTAGIIPGWEPQLYGVSTKLHGVELSNGGQVFLDGAYFA
jgi:hypothetical protein